MRQTICTMKCLGKKLLRKTYEAKWTGHLIKERTPTLLSKSYYLSEMREDVQAYARSYLACRLDKTEKKKVVGLMLQHFPILERP